MTPPTARTGPCAGIKVLELGTTMVSGPFCGQFLGDLGADVIKVESPDGDMMRSVPPLKDGASGQFLQFNRNKRSITIDLKSVDGRELAQALICRSDVLIENFRPGVTARLGLDYAAAREINPRLIYVTINGFGSDGPYAHLPAYDQVIQGLSGFMPIQGTAERPEPIHSVIVDKITSLSAATATLAALVERQRTGAGQHVQVAMLDAFAAVMLPELLAGRAFVDQPPSPLPPPGIYRSLRTADGHLLGLIVQQHQFTAICKALGRDDLIDDTRFSNPNRRFAAMDELLTELETVTSKRTTAELLKLLWADGGIAIAPVHSLESFLDDPQVRHNGTVFTAAHPVGEVRQLAPFARLESVDTDTFTGAPALGADTDGILAELALPPDRIADLRARRVVG